MEVRPIHSRLFTGKSMPAIRAIRLLALTLLVLRITTDHPNDAAPMNDFALITNLLNGSSNLHCRSIFASLLNSEGSDARSPVWDLLSQIPESSPVRLAHPR